MLGTRALPKGSWTIEGRGEMLGSDRAEPGHGFCLALLVPARGAWWAMNTRPGWAHRHSQPCGVGANREAGTPPGGWLLLPSAGGAVGTEPALRGNQGSREAELLQGRTGVRTEHSQDGAWLSLPRERGCGEGEGMGPGDISQHRKASCLYVGAKKVPCVWTLLNMSLTERKAVLTKQTG